MIIISVKTHELQTCTSLITIISTQQIFQNKGNTNIKNGVENENVNDPFSRQDI